MTGSIYVLRNKTNGKCYVGQSVNVKQRFRHHKAGYGHTYIARAIGKYGWDNFDTWQCEDVPLDFLDDLERRMIEKLGTLKPEGYNLDSGGNKLKGQHPDSNAKRSRAMMGEKHPLYGTHLTDAQRKHLSDHWKGRGFSETHLRHLSEASKGKPKSEAHKAKCRLAALGKNMGTDNVNARAIYCVDTGEIFLSMADAIRKYNLHSGHLSYCCEGKLKSHGGKRWAYMEAA